MQAVEGHLRNGMLHQTNDCRNRQGQCQRPNKDAHTLCFVLRATGLGSQSAGAHSEEAKQPVGDIEKQAAHCDGRNGIRRSHVAHNSRIGQSQEWDGQVADNAGDSYAQYFFQGRFYKLACDGFAAIVP